MNYRILYFFHGRNIAILVNALTKEDKLPNVELNRASRRKALFESDSSVHSFEEDIPNA